MRERDMTGDAVTAVAAANLGAFFRHRGDVPMACGSALISSLSRLRAADDPVVTFGGLPGACVPEFADGCQVELSDGAEPLFQVTQPDSHLPADPAHLLTTPVKAVSRAGYPSYAGVITHWWTGRLPSESDAVIADLMVRHLVALVEHERLITAMARAEDRAASLALEAIAGRTISLATGIVMHQDGITADDAEALLRQTGRNLHQVAASVVRSGSLGAGRCRERHDAPARSIRPGHWQPHR
jgi:hypothetical protein